MRNGDSSLDAKRGLCTAFSKGDFMKKPRVFSGAWLSLMVLGLAVVSCDSSSIDNKPNANNNPGTEANPIPLSANIWADGSITSSENTVWYTFNGTQGTTYYIWWNNSYQGNSTKTSDVYVSAVCNGSTIFQNVDSGRSNGRAFIANTTGTVKIKVTGSTGTFAIAYSTTSTRPISYTVIFHANSGSGTVPSAQAVEGGSSITLPSGSSLTKTGYTFGGWNTNTSGTGTTYGAGSSFTPTASITLYAKWDAPTQTISPDRIEYYWVDQHDSLATTSGGATSIASGATLTITAQGTGYVARQWHLNGVNTGQNGNTYTFSSTTVGNHTVGLFVEKDGKLYNTNIIITVGTAQFTVSFNANSATTGTAPGTITANAGSSITLPGQGSLARTGYTFGGWNTNSSGTGTNYNAGSSYTPTANVTLYARWNVAATGLGTEGNPISLTAGTWADGSVTSGTSAVWYSFNVTSGTTYYVWWNDSYSGNGTKTGDVSVSAVYSNGTSIFTNVDSGWGSYQTFTASSSTTVKIKVVPYNNSSSYTGTFAVAYRTTSTRP
jgi:uncharacterized repeat protein (TIGR02543 family)